MNTRELGKFKTVWTRMWLGSPNFYVVFVLFICLYIATFTFSFGMWMARLNGENVLWSLLEMFLGSFFFFSLLQVKIWKKHLPEYKQKEFEKNIEHLRRRILLLERESQGDLFGLDSVFLRTREFLMAVQESGDVGAFRKAEDIIQDIATLVSTKKERLELKSRIKKVRKALQF